MKLPLSPNILSRIIFVILLFSFYPPAIAKKDSVSAVNIAVVNVRHLLQHAPQSGAASKALKERFIAKEKILDAEASSIRNFEESIKQAEGSITREEKIEKERELRSRKRAQNRALEDYREDLRLAKSAALDDVQKAVFEAIDEIRKAQAIDIVIQDFISASERVDITQTVLSYLAQQLEKDSLNKQSEK